MPIIARGKKKKEYPTHPEGTYQGVCCDVVDLGDVETEWQGKKRVTHKVLIYWQTGETYNYVDDVTNETKEARHIVIKRYTCSLDQKANLRKDLESWRGKAFTDKELKRFDLENLLGANAILTIVHNVNNEVTYANVSTVAKLMNGMEGLEVKDYIRQIDREENKEEPTEEESDSVPF